MLLSSQRDNSYYKVLKSPEISRILGLFLFLCVCFPLTRFVFVWRSLFPFIEYFMFRLDCFIRQSGLFLFSGTSIIGFKGELMKKIKKIFARGLIFCPSRDLPLEGQNFSHLNFDNRIHIHQIRYLSRGESPKPKEGTPRTTCLYGH